MKMEIKGDTSGMKWLIAIMVITIIALVVTGVREGDFLKSSCIALPFVALIGAILFVWNREKLIIDDNGLCYKSVRKKYYDVSDVKRIYIVNAQIKLTKSAVDTFYDKYVMVYMKDTEVKWDGQQGALEIQMQNGKHILFTTEYDERAVEFFRSKKIPIAGKISYNGGNG